MTQPHDVGSDVWSEWLLHHRHADDPEYGRVVKEAVAGYVDRVLDGAQIDTGMTLLDVGAGEGLVAFRAIDRVGPSIRVILTDISAPMLRHAEAAAVERGVRGLCTFLECGAESLRGVDDSSVDVVTTRAVLAYVCDKRAAFGEFYRVLKPGGRISLTEPILQDEAFYARALRKRVQDPANRADHFLTLLHRWKAAQFPDTEEACAKSPIANFSERDLVAMACAAGFVETRLQLHIDATPSPIKSWEVFLGTSPHPLAPTLNQIFEAQFSVEERRLFEKVVRPNIESGNNVTIERTAYLQARKPVA